MSTDPPDFPSGFPAAVPSRRALTPAERTGRTRDLLRELGNLSDQQARSQLLEEIAALNADLVDAMADAIVMPPALNSIQVRETLRVVARDAYREAVLRLGPSGDCPEAALAHVARSVRNAVEHALRTQVSA